jgi:hypothetical protein
MNQHGSLVNTFMGPDIYNNTGVMLAPADLVVFAAQGQPVFLGYTDPTPAIFPGFEINDKPYLKKLGLFSNLADGLVSTPLFNQYGQQGGLFLRLQLIRFAADLTGTISNTAGLSPVVGVGTLFTQELCVGQSIWWYDDNGRLQTGVVATITDDLNLILAAGTENTGMFTVNTSGKVASPQIALAGNYKTLNLPALNLLTDFNFFIGDVTKVKPPRGVITVVAASAAVTGSGTFFTEDLEVGQAFQYTDDLGVPRVGLVNAIASNVSMTLQAVAPAATDGTRVPFNAYDSQLRIVANLPVSMEFATITIDSAFNTRPLIFNAQAVIEHSLP